VPTREISVPDRFKYLQHSMRTLLQSDYLRTLEPVGGLQVVALGDSIIGNTFGAQFGGNAPHWAPGGGTVPMSDFFGVPVWAGVYVLGSTGVWYYHVPPHLDTLLLFQPDLVIIGGISNVNADVTVAEAMDDFRDVIQQIRAAPGQSQTEFILTTGAVDLQAVPQGVDLNLDDADPSSYEFQLRALAEEVGAGFIDMRHSWNQFVMESNAENPSITQAYFQAPGDPIHAGGPGFPVLHELTAMFFRPAVECVDRAPPRVPYANPPALSSTDLKRNLPALTALTIADVNGDGHPDLAFFSLLQPGTLMLGASGSNTVPLGDVPLQSAIFANLHGSGAPDLVGIDPSGSVRIVYGGQASAPFAGSPTSMKLTGADNVTSFAVLDANQDGRTDIVVALNGGAAVRLYLNEGGTTPFAAPTTVDIPAMSGNVVQVLSADVNHDGRPDIVELLAGPPPPSGLAPVLPVGFVPDIASLISKNRLAIRINTGAPDFFPLSASYALPLGSLSPTTMAIADLDGDGYPDLVLGTDASDSNLYVFPNSGRDGTWFIDPVSLAKSGSSQCTTALRIGDVEGDGRSDIVSANGCSGSGSIDVYHNSGAITDFRTLAPTAFPTGLADVDLALADLYSSGESDVIVAGNDATGAGAVVQLSSYRPPTPVQPPPVPTQPPPPAQSGPPPSTPPPPATTTPVVTVSAPAGGGGALGGWELAVSALLLSARGLRRTWRRSRPPHVSG
jgi:hypothetical protein